MKCVFDPGFHVGDHPAIFRIVLRFHVLHGRAGKHSFRAPDYAAIRADVYRADRMRRFT